MEITSKLEKNNFPYYLYPKSNEIYQLHIKIDELLAVATVFLGKWDCAIWASAQNCNFSWNQTSNCITDSDRKLYHFSLKPLTQWKYISSCYCGDLLFITSWENTAANGTLVLSLTCMIFLYEECIGSVLTVIYFRWMMLFYRYKRWLIDTISIFKTQLPIMKNSKHEESISISSLIIRSYGIFDLKALKWTTCHCYGSQL